MAGGAIIRRRGTGHPERPPEKPRTTLYVWLLTLLACVGGLLFGYDTGIVSSTMLFLPDNEGLAPLSTLWQELIVSITPGVAALGALLAGKSSDHFGRRPVIIVASIIFMIGALVCAAAPEKITLLCGRILLGVAIGFASMIIPVYISEGAPCHLRGTLVTLYQILIASGFIVANAVAAGFAHIDPTRIGWRLMFGFAAVPAALQLIGFFFLHDTPRYLYQRGRVAECEQVLRKIYGNDEAWTRFDLAEIRAALEEEERAKKGFENTPVLVRVMQTPHVRRALLLGCAMQMFQQLVGINTILYYTGTIIQSAGVEDKITTIWISCGISAVQAMFGLAPLRFIDRLGRRPILMVSIIGLIISLSLMGGAFLLINQESAPIQQFNMTDYGSGEENFDFCTKMSNCDFCVTSSVCGFCHPNGDESQGFCLPHTASDKEHSTIGFCDGKQHTQDYTMMSSYCRTNYTWLPILVMVIYLICFAVGMGPMPWVFNAEIYPLWARSTCVSLATFTNWVFNLLIALTLLSLGEAITKYGAFFLYAGFASAAAVVFYFFVPETQGIEIEEVENLFKTAKERQFEKQELTVMGTDKGDSDSSTIELLGFGVEPEFQDIYNC